MILCTKNYFPFIQPVQQLLIKSVFDICYCVIECVQNVGKKIKCNRFLLKYGTGGLQLHSLRRNTSLRISSATVTQMADRVVIEAFSVGKIHK